MTVQNPEHKQQSHAPTKHVVLNNIGKEITKLCVDKNQAYGDAVRVVTDLMRVLYPEGISSAQMADALLLVRISDKMCRIALGDKAAFGESPFRDIAGYGLLGAAKDEMGE